MRAGDFALAWRIADAVLAARDPATRDDPRLPYHLRWVWDGTPPDGRDVVVRCYHGLGDTLQFARFIPALAARASSVTIETPEALLPLLAPLAPIVAFDPARPRPPSTCDIEIMELCHALRLRPDAVGLWLPRPIVPPIEAVALCWEAGMWDPTRSIPLSRLRTALPRRALLSLQRGPAAVEATDGFLNPADNDRDVARTGHLICAAAAVVTVDTMVAHLAGSLGVRAILLLPQPCDWRWGAAGTWYSSLTPVRQVRPGDWTEPLREVASILEKW